MTTSTAEPDTRPRLAHQPFICFEVFAFDDKPDIRPVGEVVVRCRAIYRPGIAINRGLGEKDGIDGFRDQDGAIRQFQYIDRAPPISAGRSKRFMPNAQAVGQFRTHTTYLVGCVNTGQIKYYKQAKQSIEKVFENTARLSKSRYHRYLNLLVDRSVRTSPRKDPLQLS